jgi:hypothetical protein
VAHSERRKEYGDEPVTDRSNPYRNQLLRINNGPLETTPIANYVSREQEGLEMRSLLMRSLAGSGLLLVAWAARAQGYGRYRDDDRPYDRGYYGRQGGGLIEQVQSDLSYAQAGVYSRAEAKRLGKAREELAEFQSKWNAGRFDRHELDDAIAAIQKAVDHRGLDERSRSMMWNDAQRLREFRAEYGGETYRR